MRGVLRGLLQRRHDHVLDPVQQDRRRPARPRLVGQPVQPQLREPPAPLGHGARRHPQVRGDLLVRGALRAGQHDPGPQRQGLRALRPPRPGSQLVPLGIGEHQPGLRPARALTIGQAAQPLPGEPPAPLDHRLGRSAQPGRDPLMRHPGLRAGQHDPRPQRTPRRRRPRPPGKLLTLAIGQHQHGSRMRHTHSLAI